MYSFTYKKLIFYTTYLSMPSSIFFLKIVFLGLVSPGEGIGDGTFREDGLGKGGGFLLTFSPAWKNNLNPCIKFLIMW